MRFLQACELVGVVYAGTNNETLFQTTCNLQPHLRLSFDLYIGGGCHIYDHPHILYTHAETHTYED